MSSGIRTHQPVPCAIWEDKDFLNLSELAKNIFFYLLTSRHANSLGIYVLKEGYVAEDMEISEENRSAFIRKFRAAFTEVQTSGMIDYDGETRVVLIKRHYLSANPLLFPNQIKSIKTFLGTLPKTPLIYSLKNVLRSPDVISKGKNEEALEELERLLPGEIFVPDPGRPQPERRVPPDPPKPEPDKEKSKENAQALVNLWNQICGDILAVVSEVTKARMRHIKSRLRERSLEEWEKVFRKISMSSFLTGHGKDGWAASFDWIISSYDNSVKVLEGKYDDRNGSSGPRGMDALREFSQQIQERQEEDGHGEIPIPSEEATPSYPGEDVIS
jgi:hypothetical protein